MLQWALSFSVVAVIASVAALVSYPSKLGGVAVFLTAVFVALSIMSVLTGVVGKRRDGSYSAQRAIVLVAAALGVVWLGYGWLARGWTVADIEQTFQAAANAVTRALS